MVIHARRLIRKMRGGAQAHLIEGHDGNCFVVKFFNNPQHRRVLVNEWIAAQLMRHLGIATPATALVHVSPEFLAENTDVCLQTAKARIAVKTGLHFGSRYPGHPDTTTIHDILPDTFLPFITNSDNFVGALLFDRWVSNTDRPQAIFVPLNRLEGTASGKLQFEALMIDRGFAFGGPEWLLRDSPIGGIHDQRAFYDGLGGINDCEPWLSRIEAVESDFLRHVVDTIPKCWQAACGSQIERVVRDLLTGRGRLGDSIIASANSDQRPFRNWTAARPGLASDS